MRIGGILCFFCSCAAFASLDQTNLPEYLDHIANPKVDINENWIANNNKHEILVGVTDSGVDYNHPDLVTSMHFDLDANGEPVGLGYDFVGEDPWPHPFIVMQPGKYDFNIYQRIYKQTFLENPSLEGHLSSFRAIDVELMQDMGHGTHVAGILADKDDQRIGIVPFRTGPIMDRPDQQQLPTNEVTFRAFLQAHKKAYEKGIRIVNVSMSFRETNFFKIPRLKDYLEEYSTFLQDHPDLLVVAAAGNDGEDVAELVQFPCGLQLPNVLCVGNVDEKGQLNEKSNTFTQNPNIVFANGTSVESAYPIGYCASHLDVAELMYEVAIMDMGRMNGLGADLLKKSIFRNCSRVYERDIKSGTSMAAPYVTRVAAIVKIENPNFMPTQIIHRLRQYATYKRHGLYSYNNITK